jgi:hypothetical protein
MSIAPRGILNISNPAAPDARGPHLFQRFVSTVGYQDEWWVYTCRDLKCSHSQHVGPLPAEYRKSWNAASKL